MENLNVTSKAFGNEENIPSEYTCDGVNFNPPLNIENIPEDAKSLVLIMDDPVSSKGTWTHWIVFNIGFQNGKAEIKENANPGIQAVNSFSKTSYGGPCPPSGEHRYFFRIYAIDKTLDLDETATRDEIEDAIKDSIVAVGELIGKYKRE
jgi:Raf kinase inhibitor-like YbhB/YbcL family protein